MDFSDIINIKFLFRNQKYESLQATKRWKIEHHDQVIKYHKKYNKENNVKEQIAGYCEVCHVKTANISQHNKLKKHLRNLV